VAVGSVGVGQLRKTARREKERRKSVEEEEMKKRGSRGTNPAQASVST